MATKRPCPFFQLGICAQGEKCLYAHTIDPDFKKKPCSNFMKGSCRRGADCTYSHEKEDIDLVKRVSGVAEQDQQAMQTSQALFRNFRWKVPKAGQRVAPLDRHGLSSFFKQALQLIDGEIGIMQEAITLLAGEGGLTRVEELLSQHIEHLGPTTFTYTLNLQLLPFFEILVHERLTLSIVLRPQTMTLYNYLYLGDGTGERVVKLFDTLFSHFVNAVQQEENAGNQDVWNAFNTCLAVFERLLEVNTIAHANPAFRRLAELCATVVATSSSSQPSQLLKARKHLQMVQRRLGIGQTIPKTQQRKQRSIGPHAVFALDHDLPGQLSPEGKRHDNDHPDIIDISIMPTMEETDSSRNEYLPRSDPTDWHLPGIAGLADRQFRLLREDTIGQLRDAAKFELARLRGAEVDQNQRHGSRTYAYDGVFIKDIAIDDHRGVQIVIGFTRPRLNRLDSKSARKQWWENHKRLRGDAVICLLTVDGYAAFLTVAAEFVTPTPLQKICDIASDAEIAYIVAQPVNQAAMTDLLTLWLEGVAEGTRALVEFPGVLLPAFVPTLRSMQSLSTTLQLPFSDILAPEAASSDPLKPVNLPPPPYSVQAGFSFNLQVLLRPGESMQFSPGDDIEEASKQLAELSPFDPGQAQAIISSLAHSLTCIQGPPGTGKSFTGVGIVQTHLHNRLDSGVGPIIMVTFTNHALDQVLERLHREGVQKILRIGSRSKSEMLQHCNLREVAKRLDLTKTEKAARFDAMEKVKGEARALNEILAALRILGNRDSTEDFLAAHYPKHHAQLFGDEPDENGFKVVRHHKGDELASWLDSGIRTSQPRSVAELRDVNIFSMHREERSVLFNSWYTEYKAELYTRFEDALSAYQQHQKTLDDIKKELDSRVLRQAHIIGLTTSGLARNLDLVRTTNAKVLICEEAGEVMEAHMLTALLPSIEHTVLIGDHQQLRPHVQNHSLSMESRNGQQYALDMSLFERLVRPPHDFFPTLTCSTLTIQRRMFPSISRLIRQTEYPALQDADSVSQYPAVAGMRHRLFWMHHENLEDEGLDAIQSTSHTNDFEVEMVAALVRHITQQGAYEPHEVAVITPYLGQLRAIRDRLKRTFAIMLNDRDAADLEQEEEVDDTNDDSTQIASVGSLLKALRVATVDNFQGEEAKVVIVSLVRSNTKNKPGFLTTPNRINVLLSRAQHGMYILGNATTVEVVPMWSQVLGMLRSSNAIGDGLDLCCSRHPDTPIRVRTAADFLRLSPESGCDLPCEEQLACGHACTAKCHSKMLHNAVHCMKPCTRPKKGCNHGCPKPCGDRCDKLCQELVQNVRVELSCGHVKTSLPCYQHQNNDLIVCRELVQKTVPGCKHVITEECHVDVTSPAYRCPAVCGASRSCGHICPRPCSLCNTRLNGRMTKREHGRCQQICGRGFTTCKHSCNQSCHAGRPCALCPRDCDNRCSHATCGKKCSEACIPCQEPDCSSGQQCPHSESCSMPCAAPCDWLPCSKRCDKLLSCGCRCPSICGEECPSEKYCQDCCSEEISSLQADLIMFTDYGSIDLDETPCIFTACGHIFTVDSLDGTMDMKNHYEIDPASGTIRGLKGASEALADNAVELKTCPECRGSLRNIARYGRIVRRALLDESTKRLITWSNEKLRSLFSMLISTQEELLGSLTESSKPKQDVVIAGALDAQIKNVRRLNTSKRYRKMFGLIAEVERFVKRVSTEEHPYQRVHDLVEHARRTNTTNNEVSAMTTEIQPREHLQAMNLQLRCYAVLINDILTIHAKSAPAQGKGDLQLELSVQRTMCNDIASTAESSKNVVQQIEALLLFARFGALERSVAALGVDTEEVVQELMDQINEESLDHIERAEVLCKQQMELRGKRATPAAPDGQAANPIEDLLAEAGELRRLLSEGLTDAEMRMVFATMSQELRGTGRWYRCVNGHPFTVGECGAPMQLASCPECGANIGGQNHQAAQGVTAASNIEERFAGMAL